MNRQSVLFEGDARSTHRPRNPGLELVVDNFAGGGGASLGIERAIGRAVDLAINHSPDAMAIHQMNHPDTWHLTEDLYGVDPVVATRGLPVGLAWFSPDCKHFSRAKGSKPVEKRIRGLAWVAIKWARAVKPRVIFLENVREFADWGPLGPDRRPCPRRKGNTFRLFVGRLKAAGYNVEHRVLDAADFGAPTHRRRLFLIARSDGQAIQWPTPTHGPGRRRKWRPAAECIQWSLPCRSIFDRPKPLADKTLRRIAMGIKRYVLDAANPFIVRVEHGGDHFRGQSTDDPLGTVTSKNGYALVMPIFVGAGGPSYGGKPRPLDEPMGVIQTENHSALVAAFLSKFNTGVVGTSLDEPIGTVTAIDHHALVAVNLARFNHGEKQWASAEAPLGTITSQGNKFGVVYAFLMKYFGTAVGQGVDEPMHTQTARSRFAVVQIKTAPGVFENAIAINPPGVGPCIIYDIGLRMVEPRELATAQGFPAEYLLPPTKSKAVAAIGNSVCPQVAEAIVRANYADPKPRAKPVRERRPVEQTGGLLFGAWA